jgi:hypothetical protein
LASSELNKHAKESEIKYAQFFIDWLNKTNNLDYQVLANQEENSPVDVYAVSKIRNSRLQLQLVTSGGSTMRLADANTRRLEKNEPLAVENVEWKQWIIDAIKKKDKKYALAVRQDLILLIEGCLPVPNPQWIGETFQTLSRLTFRGIYYVSPPVESSSRACYIRNGFVVPIKNIFEGDRF